MVYNAQQPFDFSGLQAAFAQIARQREQRKMQESAEEERERLRQEQMAAQEQQAQAKAAQEQHKQGAIAKALQGDATELQTHYPELAFKLLDEQRAAKKFETEQGMMQRDQARAKQESTARLQMWVADKLAGGADPIALQEMVDKHAAGGQIDRFEVTGGNLEGPAAPLDMQTQSQAQAQVLGLDPEQQQKLSSTARMLIEAGYKPGSPAFEREMRKQLAGKAKGNAISVNVNAGGMHELGTATKNAQEREVMRADRTLAILDTIERDINAVGGFEEFASAGAQGSAAITNFASRFGLGSKEAKEKAAAYNRAVANMQGFTNQMMKEMGGANISPAEEARIRKGFMSEGDSAEELKAKASVLRKQMQIIRTQGAQALADGLRLGTAPEYGKKGQSGKRTKSAGKYRDPDHAAQFLDGPELDAWIDDWETRQ